MSPSDEVRPNTATVPPTNAATPPVIVAADAKENLLSVPDSVAHLSGL